MEKVLSQIASPTVGCPLCKWFCFECAVWPHISPRAPRSRLAVLGPWAQESLGKTLRTWGRVLAQDCMGEALHPPSFQHRHLWDGTTGGTCMLDSVLELPMWAAQVSCPTQQCCQETLRGNLEKFQKLCSVWKMSLRPADEYEGLP